MKLHNCIALILTPFGIVSYAQNVPNPQNTLDTPIPNSQGITTLIQDLARKQQALNSLLDFSQTTVSTAQKKYSSQPYRPMPTLIQDLSRKQQALNSLLDFSQPTVSTAQKKYSSRPYGPMSATACTREECKQSFTQKSDLKKHIKRVHNNTRFYQCNACSRRFAHIGHRNRHQKIHSKQYRFMCLLCNSKFNRKENCIRHLIQVHKKQVQEINTTM